MGEHIFRKEPFHTPRACYLGSWHVCWAQLLTRPLETSLQAALQHAMAK